MRRLAHAFLAAGNDDVAVTVADRLVAERHGAQPGAAQLVDAVGGRLARDTGRDAAWRAGFWPSPAARIWPRMTSETSLGSTSARRSADRDLAELVRREAGEPAVERPDRGAGGAGDDHRKIRELAIPYGTRSLIY